MLAGYLILLLGPIAGMRCTRINENAGQSSGKWTTTYLCVPQDSPYLIEFSNNGPISSSCGRCLSMSCGNNTVEWQNNYLCFKCRTCKRGELISGYTAQKMKFSVKDLFR